MAMPQITVHDVNEFFAVADAIVAGLALLALKILGLLYLLRFDWRRLSDKEETKSEDREPKEPFAA